MEEILNGHDHLRSKEISCGKQDTMFIGLLKLLGNNMKVYSTDVCVPISNLVECISWAEKEVKKHDLIAPMVGHVGDGNFHSIILFDPNDKEKQKKIRKYSDDLN